MLDTMDGVWCPPLPLKCASWKRADADTLRYIQAKRDGWQVEFYKQPNGELYVFGKKREAHLELSHQLDHLPEYAALDKNLRPGCSVAGEVWVPGQPASSVVTAMKQRWSNLVFTPFAVPYVHMRPAVLTMADARDDCERLGLEWVEELLYHGEPQDELIGMARQWRAEGVVLKEAHLSGWYKLKLEETADLIVMGIEPGEGKYLGMCGSLIGGWHNGEGKLTEVASCSGMDDETRDAITHRDIGRVFEARYQYIGAGGRMRHPRFIRWRDDKPASECVAI